MNTTNCVYIPTSILADGQLPAIAKLLFGAALDLGHAPVTDAKLARTIGTSVKQMHQARDKLVEANLVRAVNTLSGRGWRYCVFLTKEWNKR